MAWNVELSAGANRELKKLDPQHAKRILKFLQPVSKLADPRIAGEALHGPRLGEFWKFLVSDYRMISSIEDGRLLILRVGHRREIYR